MRRLFGTDGARGVANEFLTCEIAMGIGRAVASVLSNHNKYKPKVLIGMDTRMSSEMIASSLHAGLCSVGADVVDIGVVPTPAVAYLVRYYACDAGIMISASHNSYEFNGIKVFSGNGFKLPDELEEQIESMVLENNPAPVLALSDKIGRVKKDAEGVEVYIDHLRRSAFNSLEGLKIAVDCANGSASATAEKLFTSLGAECHMLFNTPDGININDHCGSTNLTALKAYVTENKLDAGIAFDGDADRFLAVDENGDEIDGDMVMAILSLDMKKRGVLRENTVVGTIMTNLGFVKFCEANDIQFIAAKVGDRYVLEIMNLKGYSFGGEQSGHLIFRNYATTGDGQLTAVQLLSFMKREGKPLSELSKVMRRYPQSLVNVKTTPEGKLAFYTDREINEKIQKVTEFLGTRGRLVVRPSGTEPLLRVMVESETEEETKQVAEETAAFIREKLSAY
ncbi:MAG: phosphoglucosamine mutase [Clostridia bacterium]|nr:phosphoglucosamine mutase [Clostridia bacterium]